MSYYSFYSVLKRASLAIEILIVVVAAIFFIKSCESINSIVTKDEPIRIYPEFNELDSLKQDKNISDHEMSKLLWKNQKTLNSRYDNMLADIRQETNNAIEKITAELNFWVAVLAFLGVLVPIAVTFKGERDLKDLFELKNKAADERIKLYLDSANIRLKEWNKEWNHKIEEILSNGDKIDEMKAELSLEINSICLASIRNNRILESQSELMLAHKHLAHETIKHFLRFFEHQISNRQYLQSDDKKWTLVKFSMQYYDLLRILSIDYGGLPRPRFFYEGEKAAKDLIQVLMEDLPKESDVKDKYDKLNEATRIILKNLLLNKTT